MKKSRVLAACCAVCLLRAIGGKINHDIQEMNQNLLTRHGYAVRLAMNLAEAREAWKRSSLR